MEHITISSRPSHFPSPPPTTTTEEYLLDSSSPSSWWLISQFHPMKTCHYLGRFLVILIVSLVIGSMIIMCTVLLPYAFSSSSFSSYGLWINECCFVYLILLSLFNYGMTVFSYPGYVEQQQWDFHSEDGGIDGDQQSLKWVFTKCNRCERLRPPRAHHCRICEKCILKMDHHCAWVNNCIGLYNHRYFFLSLFWFYIICWYYATVSIYLLSGIEVS